MYVLARAFVSYMYMCMYMCFNIHCAEDDADLEAELMALEGKAPKKGGKSSKSGKGGAFSMADVDSMLAGIGDIGEGGSGDDDDDDTSDIDDEDLLGELQVTFRFLLILKVTPIRQFCTSMTICMEWSENKGPHSVCVSLCDFFTSFLRLFKMTMMKRLHQSLLVGHTHPNWPPNRPPGNLPRVGGVYQYPPRRGSVVEVEGGMCRFSATDWSCISKH